MISRLSSMHEGVVGDLQGQLSIEALTESTLAAAVNVPHAAAAGGRVVESLDVELAVDTIYRGSSIA